MEMRGVAFTRPHTFALYVKIPFGRLQSTVAALRQSYLQLMAIAKAIRKLLKKDLFWVVDCTTRISDTSPTRRSPFAVTNASTLSSDFVKYSVQDLKTDVNDGSVSRRRV
jgi:hypothetical protein